MSIINKTWHFYVRKDGASGNFEPISSTLKLIPGNAPAGFDGRFSWGAFGGYYSLRGNLLTFRKAADNISVTYTVTDHDGVFLILSHRDEFSTNSSYAYLVFPNSLG